MVARHTEWFVTLQLRSAAIVLKTCIAYLRLLTSVQPTTSAWSHLRSLTFQAELHGERIRRIVDILYQFHPRSLVDVTLHLHSDTVGTLVRWISCTAEYIPYRCQELEKVLLQFPHPALAFVLNSRVRSARTNFWLDELAPYLPILRARNRLSITSRQGQHVPTIISLGISAHCVLRHR